MSFEILIFSNSQSDCDDDRKSFVAMTFYDICEIKFRIKLILWRIKFVTENSNFSTFGDYDINKSLKKP